MVVNGWPIGVFRYAVSIDAAHLHNNRSTQCHTISHCSLLGKQFRNAFEIQERIVTFVRRFDIKVYANKQSLGRKGLGTAFPLKKTL